MVKLPRRSSADAPQGRAPSSSIRGIMPRRRQAGEGAHLATSGDTVRTDRAGLDRAGVRPQGGGAFSSSGMGAVIRTVLLTMLQRTRDRPWTSRVCKQGQRFMRDGGIAHDLTFSQAPLRQAKSANSWSIRGNPNSSVISSIARSESCTIR